MKITNLLLLLTMGIRIHEISDYILPASIDFSSMRLICYLQLLLLREYWVLSTKN